MSKWNLFEIFSHLHVTGEDLPKIRRTARISRRAVRSRVLASLDEEAAAGVPARSHAPHWKMGRIPAVLTAAAATGGFSQLMQLVFGKDVSYPSTLEELYAVPEVKMTDTCEDIDCQVLGVFGDEHTVNFVLEFSGVNGFQLPETPRFFGEFPCCIALIWSNSSKFSETFCQSSADKGFLVLMSAIE